MHDLAVVILRRQQLRHRHLGERKRLVVGRQQDLAELGNAGIDVARGQPQVDGRAVIGLL
jgi:hypothetical protein